MDVAIIDYKMGNLYSVKAACANVGLSSIISSDHSEILDAEVAILPGVGAYGEAMHNLSALKLDEIIFKFIDSGKQFIGICLGFQLLFENSNEFGLNSGLGVLKGSVKKIKLNTSNNDRFPIPQIGWNKIKNIGKSWKNTLLSKNENEDFMYFIHSYYVEPHDENIILANTNYGRFEYCSSINYKNIFATQFHPEKSSYKGILIYENIFNLIKSKRKN